MSVTDLAPAAATPIEAEIAKTVALVSMVSVESASMRTSPESAVALESDT